VVPLQGALAKIIERRRKAKNGAYVFHFHGYRTIHRKRGGWRRREMRIWHAACERAGIGDTIPYDLRRCAVKNLRAAGVAERVAMEISGHRTRATFDRYGIVDDRDLKAAFVAVENRHKKRHKAA
jgi:integrase